VSQSDELDLSQFEGHTAEPVMWAIRYRGEWMAGNYGTFSSYEKAAEEFTQRQAAYPQDAHLRQLLPLYAAAPQLLEEVKRLRADKARLDWLEAEALQTVDNETGESFYEVRGDFLKGWSVSIRASIDAARGAKP
jgi:hypothetical protein